MPKGTSRHVQPRVISEATMHERVHVYLAVQRDRVSAFVGLLADSR